ncbi:MAG: phosphatase PAP2 family protein, partial [Acidobacteriota bacterium]
SGVRLPLVVALAGLLAVSATGRAMAVDRAAAADLPGPPPRRALREACRTFAADGRYLITFPARASVKGAWLTAGVAAATALAINRDEEVRAHVLEADGRTARRVATKLEPLGRYEVEAAALGTLYLIGRRTGDARLVSTAATAFESYLWAGIITSVSKGAFGRERPGLGSEEGRFFAGDTIFPSGHTTRSFAIAAVLAERHGRRPALIAYPVAALIGLSTVEEDRHWVSDIIAGAGLGLAIGKGIAARHPAAAPGAPRAAWQVVPRPGGTTIRISF